MAVLILFIQEEWNEFMENNVPSIQERTGQGMGGEVIGGVNE